MTARSRKPEPPYAWFSKDALRRIRERFDGDSLQPFALATYAALAVNASDKQAESFETLQGHLALLAGGISTKTIQRVLPALKEIGLIAYDTPKRKGPITFTLLSVATNSPNDATNSPSVATGEISAPSPTTEGINERIKEESGINGADASKPLKSKVPCSLLEATAYAKDIGLPDGEADAFYDHHSATGWRLKGGLPVREWKAAMRNWKRNGEKFARERASRKPAPKTYTTLFEKGQY